MRSEKLFTWAAEVNLTGSVNTFNLLTSDVWGWSDLINVRTVFDAPLFCSFEDLSAVSSLHVEVRKISVKSQMMMWLDFKDDDFHFTLKLLQEYTQKCFSLKRRVKKTTKTRDFPLKLQNINVFPFHISQIWPAHSCHYV